MTYCGPFVPHFPRRTSTLRRRLASPLAIHRYGFTRLGSLRLRSRTQEAVDAIQAILFYRAQPSVPPPTIPASRCALPASSASSRRPVSARALRCGLRSSFLVTAPSLRLVATTRLRTTPHRKLASCRSPPGGIVPPGLVMRRPSGPPCLRRVRSTQAGGFLPKIATHFVCVAVALLRLRSIQRGGLPARCCDGFLPSPYSRC